MGSPELIGVIIARVAPTFIVKGPAPMSQPAAQPVTAPRTPYQRVGGAPAVQSVVDFLYFLVMRDEQVKPYFNQSYLPSVKAHMVKLLSQVLGGPREYTGRALRDAHAHLGIRPEHYERVGRYVVASLLVHHVPADVVESVQGVLAGAAGDVIGTPGVAA